MSGFVKNSLLLEEDHKVTDLLDFSVEVDKLKGQIQSIQYSSLLGYVGRFGSGKSTTIFQLQKEEDDGVRWFDFDAWKYPERRDLWEGFVLEIADQLGKRKELLQNAATVVTIAAIVLNRPYLTQAFLKLIALIA